MQAFQKKTESHKKKTYSQCDSLLDIEYPKDPYNYPKLTSCPNTSHIYLHLTDPSNPVRKYHRHPYESHEVPRDDSGSGPLSTGQA